MIVDSKKWAHLVSEVSIFEYRSRTTLHVIAAVQCPSSLHCSKVVERLAVQQSLAETPVNCSTYSSLTFTSNYQAH